MMPKQKRWQDMDPSPATIRVTGPMTVDCLLKAPLSDMPRAIAALSDAELEKLREVTHELNYIAGVEAGNR